MDSTAGASTISPELGGTKELATTVKESMSLIDRFYNGGNHAKPEALDILVVVLDAVVRTREAELAEQQRNPFQMKWPQCEYMGKVFRFEEIEHDPGRSWISIRRFMRRPESRRPWRSPGET